MVVVLENKDAADVLGSGAAPFLDRLAATGATFSDAHAETHPSQPNYLALFSGSTQRVTDDSCLGSLDAPSLGGQLIAAGRSFAGYSEGLPAPGFTGCTQGDYARKHNPWVDFRDVPATANLPLSQMPSDYTRLPTVAFVIPNLCSDMHDCDVTTGDRWLQQHLSDYLAWAHTHRSLLIVTFDEADADPGNRIATTVDGAGVRPGTYPERIDHYRLLRTIEDMYHLSPLGRAGSATPITSIWAGP
jgi:phosphatidylinositol-3-phosphatase